MGYTRNNEKAVIGTLMSEPELFETYGISLTKEIFSDKRNAFIFGIMDDMRKDGCVSFYPYDIFVYADEKNIAYGDMVRFCSYMCEASACWDFFGFRKRLKDVVGEYVKRIGYGKM